MEEIKIDEMLRAVDSSTMQLCEGLRGKQGDDMFFAVVFTILVAMGLWKLYEGVSKERKRIK